MSSQPLHARVHDRVETAFTISGIRNTDLPLLHDLEGT